jgi:uncharacterized membrane protein YebE (DUF533 family)
MLAIITILIIGMVVALGLLAYSVYLTWEPQSDKDQQGRLKRR